jgi:hypothetical protein
VTKCTFGFGPELLLRQTRGRGASVRLSDEMGETSEVPELEVP